MGYALKLFTLVFILTLSFFLPGLSRGASDEIPRITVEELKKMMDEKADVTILDVQSKAAYGKGHIKGALSSPWAPKLTDPQVTSLPRNKPIVAYCDCGPGEQDSASIAERLTELGFTNVKVLKDPSIRGWKKAGYPTE